MCGGRGPIAPPFVSVGDGTAAPAGLIADPRRLSPQDDFLLIHYDKGPCRNKLGHSRASVIWHRTQVGATHLGLALARMRTRVCARARVHVWFSEDVPVGRGFAT